MRGACLRHPLAALGDDEHRVRRVQGLGRVVTHERAVQLFVEEFGRLVRLRRAALVEIREALFPDMEGCAVERDLDDRDW